MPLIPSKVIPVLHVDRNDVNQGGLTPGSSPVVAFNNKVIDNRGWFDAASSYKHTPLMAGYYEYTLAVAVYVGTNGESGNAIIRKNGATPAYYGQYFPKTALTAGSTDWLTSTAHAIIAMNGSTDYIEFMAYIPAGSTAIQGGTVFTRAIGKYLGPV